MGYQFVRFIFFSNYFVGLLAVALAIETIFQLGLPFNALPFYCFLFLATVVYYTKAYTGYHVVIHNPRSLWYARHAGFIKTSQGISMLLLVLAGAYLLYSNLGTIMQLPLVYWLVVLSIPVAGLLYYGMEPGKLLGISLRNKGWLKPFVIGYVWAAVVGVLPVVMLMTERKIATVQYGLMCWLFIKNWMFCTVNAIMFDIKDYADDSNRQLKTFVVRIGLRKTIFSVLIPLLLLGLLSFFLFALHRHFGLLPIVCNLIPFICLLLVAYDLHHRKPILYYLIVIDGLLLVKAFCGIIGMYFVDHCII